jgi:hypothetical protein
MDTLLTLLLFATPAPPPAYWDYLPDRAKRAVVAEAERVGLTHPARELVGDFRGAVYVWRMRYAGTPLPRESDPIFGR